MTYSPNQWTYQRPEISWLSDSLVNYSSESMVYKIFRATSFLPGIKEDWRQSYLSWSFSQEIHTRKTRR